MSAPVFATTSYVDGKVESSGGGSRVIASLENVNLKDVAANPLTWADGKSAANTFNYILNVVPVSGTYASISAEQGYCEISIDSGNEGNTNFSVGGVSMADVNGTADQATVIAILIGTFPPSNWSITNPSGNIIRFTEPVGQSGLNNGDTISVTTDGSITTSGATPVSGGVSATKIEVRFLDDAEKQDITGTVAQIVVGENTMRTSPSGSIIASTGDISLPVTVGTLNDFRVNIYILGDTI